MKWVENLREGDPKVLMQRLAIINVLNGIGMGVVGFFTIVTAGFPDLVFSLCVLLMGLLLVFFHIPIKRVQHYMLLNVGFMYSWFGRAVFLFCCAFLCISLGLLGWLCAAGTGLNLVINLVAMKVNPSLKLELLRGEADQREAAAGIKDFKNQPGMLRNNNNVEYEVWEEVVDPESGDKYYYNPQTGETTWDKPS